MTITIPLWIWYPLNVFGVVLGIALVFYVIFAVVSFTIVLFENFKD
jgi:hypothetical protein